MLSLGGATMGTRWSARLAAPPGVAARVEAAVVAALDSVVAQMSGWDAGSDLARFNRAAVGSWQALPPGFATVIAAALDIAEASGGAFDPTGGALVDLWGFGAAAIAHLPDDAAIAAVLPAVGWRNLTYDRHARRLSRATPLAIDLSGIAKGYAVDLAAAAIRACGIEHFLIEVGGELRGEGVKPDGQPWWVDLERPPGAAALPVTRVALCGLAVATSGDYRRFHEAGGHTIDPRVGRPVGNGVASVSVIAGDCMTADAWATALTVLGPEDGVRVAAERGIAALFVVREGGGWREVVSPALAGMMD